MFVHYNIYEWPSIYLPQSINLSISIISEDNLRPLLWTSLIECIGGEEALIEIESKGEYTFFLTADNKVAQGKTTNRRAGQQTKEFAVLPAK